MMNITNKNKPKYVKCSYCKVFDSISPLTPAKCKICHQPLKEISEEEYKEKLIMARKIKEERRKKQLDLIKNMISGNSNNNMNTRVSHNIDNNIDNNNNININNNPNNIRNNIDNNGDEDIYDSVHRNNSFLHSSKIKLNEKNDKNDKKDDNNNKNKTEINDPNNNNINNNNNHHHHHHGHHGIQLIGIFGGGHHGNRIMGITRDNSSDRDQNSNHHRRMIIIGPSSRHHHGLNNQNNPGNQNEIIMQRNPNQIDPFRLMVQRHHVSNDIFDPNFNIFGSRFDNVFQENFSSNFRSNFRGNFGNIIMEILRANIAENRRKKQHPISEQNIQKLKKFNLTEKYCKKGENGNFEKPNCTICLEEIEIGKETVLLPCGHMFHYDCCITWLKKSNTCPICRFEIK